MKTFCVGRKLAFPIAQMHQKVSYQLTGFGRYQEAHIDGDGDEKEEEDEPYGQEQADVLSGRR